MMTLGYRSEECAIMDNKEQAQAHTEIQVPANTRFLHPQPRRVLTEPISLQPPRRSPSVSSTSSRSGFLGATKLADESIETLYNHPSVKIIAFTTSQGGFYTGSGSHLPSEPAPGSLPASSQLERTIAVGPFRIYRAPGSVAFLNCGSALQPILPKSRCWSLDQANSCFVLQIRRPQYWRIEVPVSDPEDAHRALILREVLDGILLFEKTECPFQRSFTVQLPERPQTPVKKKPWTAAGKNLISSPFSTDLLPLPASKITNGKRRLNASVPVPKAHAATEDLETRKVTPSPTESISALPSLPDVNAETETDTDVTKTSHNAEENTSVSMSSGTTADTTPVTSEETTPKTIAGRTAEVTMGATADITVVTMPENAADNLTRTEAEAPTREQDAPTREQDAPTREQDAPTREQDAPTREQDEPTREQDEPTREQDKAANINVPAPKQSRATAQASMTTLPDKDSKTFLPIQPSSKGQSGGMFPYRSNPIAVRSIPLVDLESTSQQVNTPLVDSAVGPLMRSGVSESESAQPKEPLGTTEKESSVNLSTQTVSITSLPSQIPVLNEVNDFKSAASNNGQAKDKEEIIGEIKDDGPQSFEGAGSVGVVSLKKKRMSRMLAGRSVSLPPQLTVITSPPSKSGQPSAPENLAGPLSLTHEDSFEPMPEETSPVGSMDSFHSVQSWHSPITPNPPSPPSSSASPHLFPYPHENVVLPVKDRGMSNLAGADITPVTDGTIMPSSAGATIRSFDIDIPGSYSATEEEPVGLPLPLESSASSFAVSERPGLKHRGKSTNLSISRQAFSPLPTATNLFSPSRRQPPASRLAAVGKLPSAIIHKTVEILLSPPGHLVNLMLKVAAKIAAGEWRGLVFGLGEGGESIPVHWDYSDGELSSWEDDDDYHFSIGRLSKEPSKSKEPASRQSTFHVKSSSLEDDQNNDGSWEVD